MLDSDDLTRRISPRPLGSVAGDHGRYALDAAAIADATRQAYLQANAIDRLQVDITPATTHSQPNAPDASL